MLRAFLSRRHSALLPRLHQTPYSYSSCLISHFFSTQSKQESTPESPSDSTAQQSTNSKENSTQPEQNAQETNVQELEQSVADLQLQVAELKDRVLRELAEMENVRTIARRDVENAKRYSILPFATSLLSVADNLGLALKAVPKETLEDPNSVQLKGLYFGVGATEAELLKVFAQHGITRFGDIGDKFDPNRYQALFEAPVEGREPGTVIDVTKVGYVMGDRVLRPAEVGVCKAS